MVVARCRRAPREATQLEELREVESAADHSTWFERVRDGARAPRPESFGRPCALRYNRHSPTDFLAAPGVGLAKMISGDLRGPFGGHVRRIDTDAIKSYATRRFRSEYDYALFEYFRSAKVISFLEQVGVKFGGRLLDAGCGGGGMALSFAEEVDEVVAIDLAARFDDAGFRLAAERGVRNLSFARADGQALPFEDASFDIVLSHAVIEHVADAQRYLLELARVVKPGGVIYLSTAPYLSFTGAHLPRLRIPVPLHLLLGRRASFATFNFLARHLPWTLQEPEHENSFIKLAREGHTKSDDLLEKVQVPRLRDQIGGAKLAIVTEVLRPTGTFRRLPAPVLGWLLGTPVVQDIIIGDIEYVLRRRQEG
jgi:2-polyprenyl-3-methyl-5-hydroxy-6-metoxy-1,4-benzoquinol methylase